MEEKDNLNIKKNIIEKHDISLHQKVKKIVKWCKSNVSLLALLLPIIITVVGTIFNFYFYSIQYVWACGYFKYLGCDNSKVNFIVNISLYKIILYSVIYLFFWSYNTYAVRFFYTRTRIIDKLRYVFFVPYLFVLSVLIIIIVKINGKEFVLKNFFTILALSFGLNVIICLLFFIFGLYGDGGFNKDVKNKERRHILFNKKKSIVDDSKDEKYDINDLKKDIIQFIVSSSAMFIIVLVIVYFGGYYSAKSKKQFNVISINDKKYVEILNQDNETIIDKCEIQDESIQIYKKIYMIVDKNEMEYHNKNFSNVKIIN